MRHSWGSTQSVHHALVLAVLAGASAGCATTSPAEFVQTAPDAAALREVQTRRFDGIGEDRLLSASVAVLQDLGFTIKTSSARLGFTKGVKDREAKAPDQVAAVTILMLLAVAAGGGAGAPQPGSSEMPQEQTISVFLVTRPLAGGAGRNHEVRVSFQRFLRQPLRVEAGVLREAQLYEAFFELLSKAIFLEAHRL